MDLNSAGFGHMFPYSNIHELNIDWLLVTVKEMEAKVVSLEERIAEAEQRIEDHEQRMQVIETEIATLRQEWESFKQYVENRFDELEQNIRDLFVELEAKIDAKFAQLEHDINDKFTALESELRFEIQNVLRYIIDTCAEFTAKVTALEGRVAQLETDMQDCCITISGKLDDVLNALDELNPELREKVITQNGVYLAADEGATGFWKVTVNVDTGTSVLVPLEVTANGTYNPETGTDGFSSVVVNVPQAGFTTQEKTATENGEVTPDAGYDGLSKVTVDVPQRTAEALTITQNGTTQTPAGKYYDPITVDVPQRTAEPLTVSVNNTTWVTQEGKYFDPIKVQVPERTAEALTITQNGTTQTPAGKYYDPINTEVKRRILLRTNILSSVVDSDVVTDTVPVTIKSSGSYMSNIVNPVFLFTGAIEIIGKENISAEYTILGKINSYTITFSDSKPAITVDSSTSGNFTIAKASVEGAIRTLGTGAGPFYTRESSLTAPDLVYENVDTITANLNYTVYKSGGSSTTNLISSVKVSIGALLCAIS